MEAAFWNGFRLDNFIFKGINVTSPQGLVVVCLVTFIVAFVFEATRTLKDWLFLQFLKRRSCHGTNGRESPIILHDVKKPKPHGNGDAPSGSQNSRTISEKKESNGSTSTSVTGTSEVTESNFSATSGAPVIATGTLSGSGKSCKRPSFEVGLLELSISTLVHVFQVCIGYLLMLVVMTFNVWIFLAVMVGTGLGFFVFDSFNRKINTLKLNTRNNSNNK